MRCFLGLHKYSAKVAVEGDMGWVSCFVKQRCEMVRLWNRLVQLPEERLTKKIFNWDRAHNHPWSREISAIFSSSDLHICFINNLQCNVSTVKEKLFQTQKEQWMEEIWNKAKLRHYVQFKEDYFTEPYILLNLRRGQRSLCAQLRTGTLPLAIEVGRFKGIPEEQRIQYVFSVILVWWRMNFILCFIVPCTLI